MPKVRWLLSFLLPAGSACKMAFQREENRPIEHTQPSPQKTTISLIFFGWRRLIVCKYPRQGLLGNRRSEVDWNVHHGRGRNDEQPTISSHIKSAGAMLGRHIV